MQSWELIIQASGGPVTAILVRPETARCLFVFGHGMSVPVRHPFMETAARKLAECGIATLRYAFPYSEAGRRMPDPAPVLMATVRSAVAEAAARAPDLLLIAGGKSLGGRMTSLAAAEAPLPGVLGLVFYGFPLHPEGKPSTERAAHLAGIPLPMLFLQGTRDPLAELELLRPVCAALGERAELQVIEGGDHSFRVPRRRDMTDEQVQGLLADCVREWADRNLSRKGQCSRLSTTEPPRPR